MDDKYIYALRALMLLLILIWGLHAALKLLRNRRQSIPASPTAAEKANPLKPPPRQPGVWPPSSFRRPTAPPYPDWCLETSKPLPYRPFRYGPKYNVTMGLRPMVWDEWIELDNQFLKYHSDKVRRMAERGEKCCKTAPEAYPAVIELLEELTGYLTERYPSLYAPLGAGRRGCTNLATGDVVDIDNIPPGTDPMALAGKLTQDDLALMFERPDNQYYLLAGSILLAGFWRLSDKFGMPLSEIHTSGDVPQFREKLEKGMMSFFRRLAPEKPMLRNNYFIQVDDELSWSTSIGSEDAKEVEGWKTAQKNKAVEHHWFRSERQSLRRLPRTGAVLFTIRTYFLPIVDMCEEVGVPGRLASAVRSHFDHFDDGGTLAALRHADVSAVTGGACCISRPMDVEVDFYICTMFRRDANNTPTS